MSGGRGQRTFTTSSFRCGQLSRASSTALGSLCRASMLISIASVWHCMMCLKQLCCMEVSLH